MRSKSFVSFGAWLMLTATMTLAAEGGPAVEPAAQAAAARALKVYGGQDLAGMPSVDQIGEAALGEPLAVHMVRLDELKWYQPGSASDPAVLLHDLQTVVYPIRVAGRLHGEMVMARVGGSWSARSFAGPAHLQAVENIRKRLARTTDGRAAAMMLVRVQALNLEFIAYRDQAGLQLTPTADTPDAGLSAGETVPASRLFERLVPLARRHNGLSG